MGVVLADAGYGDEDPLARGHTELGWLYALGIARQHTVWAPGTAPCRPKSPGAVVAYGQRGLARAGKSRLEVKTLGHGICLKRAYSRITWSEGPTPGPSSRFADLRVRPALTDDY